MDCSICGKPITKEANGWDGGYNAQPVNNGTCCKVCDNTIVIQARLTQAGYSRKQAGALVKELGEAVGN